MSRLPPLSIVLTDDEVALIRSTIWDTDLEGTVRRLLTRATAVRGGQRISGTDEEIDQLLGAVWVEIRGYQRLDDERAGRELDEPVPGSTAARLSIIYDKIEQHLS